MYCIPRAKFAVRKRARIKRNSCEPRAGKRAPVRQKGRLLRPNGRMRIVLNVTIRNELVMVERFLPTKCLTERLQETSYQLSAVS